MREFIKKDYRVYKALQILIRARKPLTRYEIAEKLNLQRREHHLDGSYWGTKKSYWYFVSLPTLWVRLLSTPDPHYLPFRGYDRKSAPLIQCVGRRNVNGISQKLWVPTEFGRKLYKEAR